MKKLFLALAVIVGTVFFFSFNTSKPPTTFKQDMEAFDGFLHSKLIELSAATTAQDTLNIVDEVDVQVSALNNKWNINYEMRTAQSIWPLQSAFCAIHCAANLALCPKEPFDARACLINYQICMLSCN